MKVLPRARQQHPPVTPWTKNDTDRAVDAVLRVFASETQVMSAGERMLTARLLAEKLEIAGRSE